ncbi:DNA mismatch repair protein msh6 [Chytriomyces hyalinus]|nr:DNA mismatch repair protein msh6 [Chytriomyces hyalinus]
MIGGGRGGSSSNSSNKKDKEAASAKGKTQRTILSFFSSPATAKTADEKDKSQTPTNHSNESLLNAQFIPADHIPKTPSASASRRESATFQAAQATQSPVPITAASPTIATSRKRSKFVIEDDDSEGESLPIAASHAKRTKPLDASSRAVPVSTEDASMDIDDSPPDALANPAVDRMRTPARKSLSQFASPRYDSVPSSSPGPSSHNDAATSFSCSTPLPTTPSAKGTPFSDKKKERSDNFKQRNDERYAWLLDERDAERRRPGDEGYDPRTLHIPQAAWNKFSPFENQFWQIKSKHWDTIVFFKKGKFYELYEKDAEVAHREFDWKMTDRVNMKMAGVPEMSFDQYAAQFVARGYKVARVDQVETSVAKDMNKKKQTGPTKKEDSIIRRELTMVLTAGTLVDTQLLTSDMSTYCMSIKEEVENDSSEPTFGVAFVDTSTAEFGISYFQDDIERTHLETLLMQLKPKELVLEKGRVSPKTAKMLKNCLNNPQCNYLIPEVEFWSAENTVEELRRTHYFGNISEEAEIEVSYPEAISSALDNSPAMSSLGGLLSYLRTLKLDKDLVSARNFHTYDPLRQVGNLVLDGQTLLNLEVFENTVDGTMEGTLFKLLNHCVTPSGKRQFKSWVCHPLQDIAAINERLDAVDDIFESSDLQDTLTSCLRGLPDLERIISRIHAGTSRVKDFMEVLHGFAAIFNMMVDVDSLNLNLKSKRLAKLLVPNGHQSLAKELKFFNEAFDQSDGLNTTDIIANTGYDTVYDEAAEKLEAVEQAFQKHRKDMEAKLGTKLTYKDLGKDLFQLEVSGSKKVPSSWTQMSKTQAVTRYYTPEIKGLLEEFLEAREERDQASKHVRNRMFARFDEHYSDWLAVVKRVAEIDCLVSLAFCRAAMGGDLCRPEFITPIEGADSTLEVEGLRHPCIVSDHGKDFIPNDTKLGGGDANMILLTGPNMGGKSTLLRQTCIAVIMAQLGCYVPATRCVMTPFERIFTRIGAHDNILAGQSTFMVELSETSKILREATPRCLVILDELGRGTSTFDGFAIAFSVLYHLVTQVRCLGLFSTHYGMLTKEFEGNPLVSLNHMSFVSDEERHQVTFLYKLAEGACPKSFGMNVAIMAGVPSSIVDTAERVASEFEVKLKMTRDHVARGEEVKMSRHADFVNLLKGRAYTLSEFEGIFAKLFEKIDKMFLTSPMRPVLRNSEVSSGGATVNSGVTKGRHRRGEGGPIESTDYLQTGGLLQGSKAVSFPVSAALPSAGGGVFRILPATVYDGGGGTVKESAKETEGTKGRGSGDARTKWAGLNEADKMHKQGRVVFVKTSRDACDGRQWNAGILREDPSIAHKRRVFMTAPNSSNGSNACQSFGEDASLDYATKHAHAALVAKLADVYKKDHLDQISSDLFHAKMCDSSSSAHSIEDSMARLTTATTNNSNSAKLNPGALRYAIQNSHILAAAPIEQNPRRRDSQSSHHLRVSPASFRASFSSASKASFSASTLAILNEPMAATSADLLSSLTQNANQQSHPSYLRQHSFNARIQPGRPVTSHLRVWQDEKSIPAHSDQRPASNPGRNGSHTGRNDSITANCQQHVRTGTPILSVPVSALSPSTDQSHTAVITPSTYNHFQPNSIELANQELHSSNSFASISKGVGGSSSRRTTSWADLNRDSEYLRKYDVNSIPGLEVGASSVRCVQRMRNGGASTVAPSVGKPGMKANG